MQREADEMYLEIAILKSNNERLANRVSELEQVFAIELTSSKNNSKTFPQILIEVTRPTTMEADEDVGHVHEILNISNHEGLNVLTKAKANVLYAKAHRKHHPQNVAIQVQNLFS